MSNIEIVDNQTNAEEPNILVPKVQYIKKAQCSRYLAFSMWIIEKMPIAPENKVAALEAMRIFDSVKEQMEFFNTFDEKENKKIITDLNKERKQALKPATVQKPRAPRKPKQTKNTNVQSDASDASDAEAPTTTRNKVRKSKKSDIEQTNATENTIIQHEIEHINPDQQEDIPPVIDETTNTKEDVPDVPVAIVQTQPENKHVEPEKKKTKTQKKVKPNAENTSSPEQTDIKPKNTKPKTTIKKNNKSKTPVPNLNIQNNQPTMVDGKYIPQSPRDPPPTSTSNPNIQPAGELQEEDCDEEEEIDDENVSVTTVTINGRMLHKTSDGRYLEMLPPHNEVFNI
jgi:hypothetical protein